jgi:ribosomal protein S18 acetylase RimI-like enzyme
MSDEHPRPATSEDLADIEDLVAASYEKYLSRMDRPPAPMFQDYSASIAAGEVWVLGRPVRGLVSLTGTSGGALLIENVAVHPSAQGSGLGRELMEFAEREAARRGLRRLVLYTSEAMTENPAIYRHLGYAEVARRTEDGYHRIYMEKVLGGTD